MLGFSPLASTALADDIGFETHDLVAGAGSFVATGQDVTFSTSEIIGTGIFTYTAQDAGLIVTKPADAGSFAVTGQDIGFRFDAKLIAQQGTYIVSPQQITDNTRKVSGTGQFTLTGQSFGIEYPLPVSEGTFTLSGQANVFGVTLSAGTASPSLTGGQ